MMWLKRTLRDESGQDMVEYGLLSALISIVAIVVLKSLGPLIVTLFFFKTKISAAG